MTDVIIKAGEWLTHEDGTRYAKALKDIERHSQVDSNHFELADGSKPVAGEMIPDDVAKANPSGEYVLSVNVGGEWRHLRAVNTEVVNNG